MKHKSFRQVMHVFMNEMEIGDEPGFLRDNANGIQEGIALALYLGKALYKCDFDLLHDMAHARLSGATGDPEMLWR